jgi:hypothetical protein
MALLLAFSSNKSNRFGNVPVYRLQKVTLSATLYPLQRFKRGYRYGPEIKR